MAGEQRGSPGHEIKDYGKITKTKGGVGGCCIGVSTEGYPGEHR